MQYSAYAGGKRIRPYLTVAFCQLFGGRDTDAIPFACALVPCECKVLLSDETERFGHIDSGLLTVGAERAILLSGSFVWNE